MYESAVRMVCPLFLVSVLVLFSIFKPQFFFFISLLSINLIDINKPNGLP